MEYVLHILILIGIYVILSESLNLIVGYAGMLSLSHAAFYGIGAYVAAIMAVKLQTPMLLNLVCAVSISGISGILIGLPSLRIRDDYFVIATFALQVIVFNVLNNWTIFTGGASGLPGIPQLTLLTMRITSHASYLLLVAILCTLTLWVIHKLVTSPFGRVLMAIREDEVFTQAVGKNVASFKVLVFIFGSCMASVAGVIYAYYVSFIDPTSFTVIESIFIVTIVIIGGAGNFWGPVVGATLLILLPELLRFVGLPGSIAANIRQILYGGLLVAFMMWRPQGLLGIRELWRR